MDSTYRLAALDVVICVAGEAAAEAGDAGAGGGLGHDHGLAPLHRGHVVPLGVLVHSLLSVASALESAARPPVCSKRCSRSLSKLHGSGTFDSV